MVLSVANPHDLIDVGHKQLLTLSRHTGELIGVVGMNSSNQGSLLAFFSLLFSSHIKAIIRNKPYPLTRCKKQHSSALCGMAILLVMQKDFLMHQ
jgi:hypothetical protein